MAGEWIAYDLALPDKPEVQELIDVTGKPVESIVFLMLRLWGWAALNTEDGTARMTLTRLVRVCGGDHAFWNAVAAVGWLEIDEAAGTVAIPGWDRRFSQSAKSRMQEAGRKKAYEERNPTRKHAPKPSDAPPSPPSDAPPSEDPTPQSRRGEREERGEDSSSPSLPPDPSPAGVGPAAWQDGWMQLRKAWNDAMPRTKWRSAEPPQQAVERLGEPGWLDEAMAAIADIRRLAANFETPPTLKQFCHRGPKGSFVARLLGGEFSEPKPKGKAS
jgi:hypothetical protein